VIDRLSRWLSPYDLDPLEMPPDFFSKFGAVTGGKSSLNPENRRNK
jgi:hypothetical protein